MDDNFYGKYNFSMLFQFFDCVIFEKKIEIFDEKLSWNFLFVVNSICMNVCMKCQNLLGFV